MRSTIARIAAAGLSGGETSVDGRVVVMGWVRTED
jgi:hypothetical protein